MARTTTNGVVLEVPYAIIRNIRNVRPWTLSIVGRNKQLRSFPATIAQAAPGIFVYTGDVVNFSLQAPCNDAAGAAFDLYTVNFSSGAETLAATVRFNAIWQKQISVTLSTINASSGAITYATAWA